MLALSPSEMENAVWENLSLIFDDMDHTHVALQHLPTVMSGRDLALAGAPEHPLVHLHSLHLSWKNLQTLELIFSVRTCILSVWLKVLTRHKSNLSP